MHARSEKKESSPELFCRQQEEETGSGRCCAEGLDTVLERDSAGAWRSEKKVFLWLCIGSKKREKGPMGRSRSRSRSPRGSYTHRLLVYSKTCARDCVGVSSQVILIEMERGRKTETRIGTEKGIKIERETGKRAEIVTETEI